MTAGSTGTLAYTEGKLVPRRTCGTNRSIDTLENRRAIEILRN